MCDICVAIAKQLFHPELKYADVIASFRNLSNEKREEISSKHGSFVDWITSTCNQLDNKDAVDFTYLVHKVIREKISLGLTAIGTLKISEIQCSLMHTTGFVSESLLKRVLNEFPEFKIAREGHDEVVKLKSESSPSKKISISLPDLKTCSPSNKASQIKALFRNHPDVVACLGKHVTWDVVNKSYLFWKGHCGNSSTNFTDWLTSMANSHSPRLYPEYIKALRLCFLKQCMNFIQAKSRTVREIRDNLTISKADLTSDSFIYEACKDSDLMTVTIPSNSMLLCKYVVSIVGKDTAVSEPLTKSSVSTTKSSGTVAVSTPRGESSDNNRFPFFISATFLRKIIPLLSCKVLCTSLISTYQSLVNEDAHVVDSWLSRYGCFLEFLLQFCKYHKKAINLEMYNDALVNQLKIIICQKLYAVESHTLPWSELIENLAPKGFADSKFIYKTVQANASRFAVVNSNVILIDDRKAQQQLKDNEMFTSLLKHPPLQKLCNVDIEFRDFFDTYHTLSVKEKEFLASNNFSFVFLVKEVFKLHHPDQYYFYRKHLNTLIFGQLLDLVQSRHKIHITQAQQIITLGNFDLISCQELLASMRIMPSKIRVVEDELFLSDLGPSNQSGSSMEAVPMDHLAQAVRGIFMSQNTIDGRIAGLLQLDNTMQEHLRDFVILRYGTLCQFISCICEDRGIFRASVEHKVAEYLNGRSMFLEELLRHLFGLRPSFMSERDLLEMLSPVKFVALNHANGTLVSEVRSAVHGKVRYFDESEKMIVETVLSLFTRQSITLSFDYTYNRICSSKHFTRVQRLFLFGKPEGELDNHLSEVYFRRFLLIFPTMFRILESDEVVIGGRSLSRRSRSRSNSVGPLERSPQKGCESERESGEVTEEEDNEKSPSKRHSKKRTNAKKDEIKAKRRRIKFKSRREIRRNKERSANESESGALHDTIMSLPNNLVQDVTMGRLLASENNQMRLNTLIDCLMSSLLNETQRVQITEQDYLRSVFQKKVLECLSTAEQVQLLDSGDEATKTVRLVLKQQAKMDVVQDSSVAIYRHVSSLTGVTSKELAVFIKALLSIQGAELDLDTVVNVSRRKYGKRSAFPNLSDDVIACQVMECLKKSSEIFINAIEATCSLREEQGDPKNQFGLNNCLENVCEKEIADFITGCLDEKLHNSGISWKNLLVEVSNYFETRLGSVSPTTLKLIVQSIVPGIETVGFTVAGKVARLQENVPDRDGTLPLDKSENEQKPEEKVEQAVVTQTVETVEELSTRPEESGVIRLDPKDQNDTRQPSDATRDKTDSSFMPNGEIDISDVITSVRQKTTNDTAEAPTEKLVSTNAVEAKSPEQQHVVSCSREAVQDVRRAKRIERHEKIFGFLVAYLSCKNFCSETVDVLMAAGREFSNERFARSPLAMEAYIREFVAFSGNLFAFGNRCGDVGVSWIFYRPHCARNAITSTPSLPLLEIMQDLVEALQVHLLTKPNRRDSLAKLCNMVVRRFADNLAVIQETERLPICRTLVLLGCIRNLDKFIFSKSAMSIGLRMETLSKTIQSLVTPLTPLSPARRPSTEELEQPLPVPRPIPLRAKAKSKTVQRNEEAIKLVAEILHNNGPCTKTELRDFWSRDAPDDLRKVLGTGVSFLFDLRKFEQYFPTSEDGKVELNDIEFQRFLLQI